MQKKSDKNQKKRAGLSSEQRAVRMQRVMFSVLAAIMIISMVVALLAK